MQQETSTTDNCDRVLNQPEWKLAVNGDHLKVYEGKLVRGLTANGKIIETGGRRYVVLDQGKQVIGEAGFSEIRKAKPVDIQKTLASLPAPASSAGQDCQLNYKRYRVTLKHFEEAILLFKPGDEIHLGSRETRRYGGYVKSNLFPGSPGACVIVPEAECNHTPPLERDTDYYSQALLGVVALSKEFERRGWTGCLTVGNVGELANASQPHPHLQVAGLAADSPALAEAGFCSYEVANARLKAPGHVVPEHPAQSRADEVATAPLKQCLVKEIRVGAFEGVVAVDPLTADPVLIMPEVRSLASLGGAEIDQLGESIVRINGFLRSKGVSNLNVIYKTPPFAANGNCFGVRWCIREKWGAYQAAGLELATRPFAFRLISTDPFEFAGHLSAYLGT